MFVVVRLSGCDNSWCGKSYSGTEAAFQSKQDAENYIEKKVASNKEKGCYPFDYIIEEVLCT